MIPLHIQSIVLTLFSLVMGGYISWPLALAEFPGTADGRVESGVPTVVPSPSLTGSPTVATLTGLSHNNGSISPQILVPLVNPRSAASPGVGPPAAAESATKIVPVARISPSEDIPGLTEYFSEIGFGMEYGDTAAVLHKWQGPVRISVHGTPTRADLATIGRVVDELNELLTDVDVEVTEGRGDLDIYFAPESRFPLIEPGYVPVNLGFFRVWWDKSGTVYRARVLVSSRGITQAERSHLIREELTQSLGLFQDSWRYPDSVFYQGWTDTNEYSSLDQALIRALYDPRLQPGMTQRQALQALKSPDAANCCQD